MQLDTIQQEIAILPPDAQQIIFDLVSILKKRYSSQNLDHLPKNNLEKSTYQKFQDSGFIGCVSVEENLSTTYKQVLYEELSKKYDHR